MKKVGETNRPFVYDLNQIPYDYTVEVRNRFKGLDLIDRVPEELWMEVHDIVQEAVIKTIPKKKKCKKAKWLSEEALQTAMKRSALKKNPRPGHLFEGNPVQYSCLENPMDRGADRLQSMGSQRVGHSYMILCAVKFTVKKNVLNCQ